MDNIYTNKWISWEHDLIWLTQPSSEQKQHIRTSNILLG